MSTHTCPVNECKAVISDALQVCGVHWRQLPASLRQAVVTTWNRFQRTTKNPRLKLAAHKDYMKVRQTAIASLNELQKKGAA